jgi:thymidylate synthase (FAD)
MRIIKPSFEILEYTPNMTKLLEVAIRTAYKSEDKMCEGSDEKIIKHIKTLNHASTLEHASITVKFITDRGVTHELVRHRMASFTQESTRYCNYSKGKFGEEITVIEPFFYVGHIEKYSSWKRAMEFAEMEYLTQLAFGAKAQEARSVLPNSLKTEIVMTANIREWLHVIALRTSDAAHPQIRQIIVPLAKSFARRWPVLFGDYVHLEHEAPAVEVVHSERDFFARAEPSKLESQTELTYE